MVDILKQCRKCKECLDIFHYYHRLPDEWHLEEAYNIGKAEHERREKEKLEKDQTKPS